MRTVHLLSLLSLCACTNATATETTEPQPGWVNREAAQVMSGPGEAYYPVAMLPLGTAVEVYHETNDGWLAIRPPEGSFSLVNAADVVQVAPGVGQINRDGTRSRVGSQLGTRRDAVHVTLGEGETVAILDSTGVEGDWLRIAPPAGEFRYVRASDVADEQPQPDSSWRSRPASGNRVVATSSEAPAPRYSPAPTEGVPPQPIDTASDLVTDATTDAADSVAPTTNAPEATGASPQAVNENPPVSIDATIDAAIDALEIAISRRVAEPINVWKLDDLERRTAELLASTADPEHQVALRQAAERLDRFMRIQQRYQATRNVADASAGAPIRPQVDDGITPLPPIAGEDRPQRPAFDAIGILKPVVSKRAGAPPYALVDDQGRIVTFISPSPSLNVQPLLGKRVGVSGTRGFMPEYQQRHVATARIEAVPQPIRR